ncbi:hypothetical protein F4821DRAFT_214971 [Hypoxylon rubiginosum]|uniref:Uncharacterized protein n=1 Tax=Hypoxylon rubiginosum TaxID=110542 RepID=A0ACC0CPS5_9PEZI|nr:hypothetical protein F4821DRAFT_214971 [Hypoxylon rubiginosum]
MAGLSLSSWLRSALPDKPFIYYERTVQREPGRSPIYASLVESIKVEKWDELSAFPDLQHLGPERDHPLDGGLAAAKPVILNAFNVLSVEANLEHFLNQSLIYCVNIALHSICRPPITIIPHVPFTAATLRDNAIRPSENYIPDYTVFKGEIEANPHLLDDHCASLLVGDVKLLGPEGIKDPVNHTTFLSRSALGQLLWYCVSRKTRLGFYISEHELVLMEFVVGREDDVVALGDAVARAELELSSPALTLPLRAQPQLNKRKYASSSTTSVISPSDLHKQKRNAPADTTGSGGSSTPSPTLPSSVPEQPDPPLTSSSPPRQVRGSEDINPQTPERDFKHPEYSSSSFVPSSPGEISAETIKDLASTGGNFTVRLYSFPFQKREHLPLALFSFISLAQRVDAKGDKNISAAPINIRDYLGRE